MFPGLLEGFEQLNNGLSCWHHQRLGVIRSGDVGCQTCGEISVDGFDRDDACDVASSGTDCKATRIFSAIVAPPNAPAVTPIKVMPIWTVERKRLGDRTSSSTVRARSSPSSARCLSRALRAETTAISVMAKGPLATNISKMMTISVMMTVIQRR